jgi:hypothetical protein
MNKLFKKICFEIEKNRPNLKELVKNYSEDIMIELSESGQRCQKRIVENIINNDAFVRNFIIILGKYDNNEEICEKAVEIFGEKSDKPWESGFISCFLMILEFEQTDLFGKSRVLEEDFIPEHIKHAVEYIKKHNYIVSLKKYGD